MTVSGERRKHYSKHFGPEVTRIDLPLSPELLAKLDERCSANLRSRPSEILMILRHALGVKK